MGLFEASIAVLTPATEPATFDRLDAAVAPAFDAAPANPDAADAAEPNAPPAFFPAAVMAPDAELAADVIEPMALAAPLEDEANVDPSVFAAALISLSSLRRSLSAEVIVLTPATCAVVLMVMEMFATAFAYSTQPRPKAIVNQSWLGVAQEQCRRCFSGATRERGGRNGYRRVRLRSAARFSCTRRIFACSS